MLGSDPTSSSSSSSSALPLPTVAVRVTLENCITVRDNLGLLCEDFLLEIHRLNLDPKDSAKLKKANQIRKIVEDLISQRISYSRDIAFGVLKDHIRNKNSALYKKLNEDTSFFIVPTTKSLKSIQNALEVIEPKRLKR